MLDEASDELKMAPSPKKRYAVQYAISERELQGAHIEITFDEEMRVYVLAVSAVGTNQDCLNHGLMILQYVTDMLARRSLRD